MKLVNSFFTSIATYSILPVPFAKWDKEKNCYAIGFLPFVGVMEAAVLIFWIYCYKTFNISSFVFAALATIIPIFLTGGIHMDGFMDTVDGIASHQTREKRLEIMKDSNTGAFACIYMCLYFVMQYSLWQSHGIEDCIVFPAIFVISRSFLVILVCLLPNARQGGMLDSLAEKGKGTTVNIILALIFMAAGLAYIYFIGKDAITLVSVLMVSLSWAIIYSIYMLKSLGGITGDTSGFFLQLCEIFLMLVI